MVSDLLEAPADMLFQARLYKLLSNILHEAHEYSLGQTNGKCIDAEVIARIGSLPYLRTSDYTAEYIDSEDRDIDLGFLSSSLENIAFELVREAIGKGLER